MQILSEGRGHLSKKNEGVQLFWDATSLKLLKACPRMYHYSQLCGWRFKSESHHLTFGTLFHKGGEYYQAERLRGVPHADAAETTVSKLLIESADWHSLDNAKNRENLIRSVVWYLEEYKDHPLKIVRLPNGKPATELSFRLQLPTTLDGEETFICGHLDEVCELENGSRFILDKKTTGGALGQRFFSSFSPDIQMTTYIYAGNIILPMPISGLLVDAAQILVGSTRFARAFVHRTKAQLEEYIEELNIWLNLAFGFAKAKNWPANETACGNYGECPFRRICSRDPGVRDSFLASDFELNPWNPLVEKGIETSDA